MLESPEGVSHHVHLILQPIENIGIKEVLRSRSPAVEVVLVPGHRVDDVIRGLQYVVQIREGAAVASLGPGTLFHVVHVWADQG